MLRQSLNQKLQQKLSPLQIQQVKLLEVSSLELGERILREVDENPALEMGEDSDLRDDDLYGTGDSDDLNNDFSLEEYERDDDIPDYKTRLEVGSQDDRKEFIPVSAGMTLHDMLLEQLDLQDLEGHKRTIAEYVIGSVDDDGYLRRNLENIGDDLAIHLGIECSQSELKEIVRMVQQFDPAGVAAADLQECLLLQLQRKQQTPEVVDAAKLLKNSFEEFSRKHYDAVLKRFGWKSEWLKQCIDEIIRLNPKPGSMYSSSLQEVLEEITPDFILENDEGVLNLVLNNSQIPELYVNPSYSNMVKDFKGNVKNQTREARDAIQFAKQKVEAARWFIDAVKTRQETLLRTMQAIIDYQYAYFIEGDEQKLRPMVLKDIASKTGYDISTISRVSNSKYIQTDFGVLSLKSFFSEGMQTETGEEVSALEIKHILESSIQEEDKHKPLTDEQLCEILLAKGYQIARRTVAKYREQLDIPVARLRKEL